MPEEEFFFTSALKEESVHVKKKKKLNANIGIKEKFFRLNDYLN